MTPSCPETVLTPDGLRLHVQVAGDGPSMLLCNGLFCSTHYFVPWVGRYARDHRVVQFDYRGHGRSADPPEPGEVTIERLTDDAEAVLRACCAQPAIVVGHSMGVRVALELWRRAPGAIGAIVLLCGSVWDALGPIPSRFPIRTAVVGTLRFADHAGPLARWVKDGVVGADLVSKVGYLLGGMSRENTPREPIEALLRNLARLDVRLMTRLARSYIAHSARGVLATVRVPALVIVGQRDSLAPPFHARRVAKRLPRGEMHVVSGCTHLAPVEKPDEIHDRVDRFLRRSGTA